jgi:hypothetical protein
MKEKHAENRIEISMVRLPFSNIDFDYLNKNPRNVFFPG